MPMIGALWGQRLNGSSESIAMNSGKVLPRWHVAMVLASACEQFTAA